ncbi:DUF6123 family protein [Heyndrickxia vini]|uniref:Group-specific protein n=1 Tax=Heyndrickxia vini TaxID=1476025 RepID=A0ABX7E896_9BACI|nr:DUF6123 family protein [Heyndrickxia vini]QQZ11082.1 hypothetical protein I5776_09435 [Heyndrickxia vini]
MEHSNISLDEYLLLLREKGFKFEDDVIGFIYFGKQYTNASDQTIKAAIEITLKTQKHFDGSFYMSLLETFKNKNIESRNQAYTYVQQIGLLPA